MADPFVHPTAEIEEGAQLGQDAMVWNWSKVRTGAVIGDRCHLGQGVFIDRDVIVGAGSKIQNGVNVYVGVTLGENVFVGPNVTFTNDRYPRADSAQWDVVETIVEDGASIGAGATIVCGVRLGQRCLVAAGSVVTEDVPPYALVGGVPARILDEVDDDGTPRGRS